MAQDIVRVTKIFTIDMAHALFGYDGPCKNIHGHTYHLYVTVSGTVNTTAGDPQQGLVVDFCVIKELTRQHVINVFDHALVLHKDAPYSAHAFLPDHFEKIILFENQPSCENLMLHFKDKLRSALPADVNLVYLRLEETPTSYAEWRVEDQQGL
jgi:6-pyruvoyltetrahydropterin/6-carboxytetrahydropterin synthase